MARKKKAAEQDVLASMFPTLPTSDDVVKEEPEQKDDTASQIAALQNEIRALTSKLTTVEQERAALMAMTPTQQSAPPPPRPTAPPDRISEPDKYAEWLIQKEKAELLHRQQLQAYEAQRTQTQQTRVNQLWQAFGESYKAYAASPEKVEIAAERAAKAAAARGLDLDKYMFGTSSAFMADVVKQYDALFGKPPENQDADDGDEGDDDGEDIRTAGLPGGANSGGRVNGVGGSKPQNDVLGSLSADIKAFQEKTGYRI